MRIGFYTDRMGHSFCKFFFLLTLDTFITFSSLQIRNFTNKYSLVVDCVCLEASFKANGDVEIDPFPSKAI